jgi:hypothetical protein
MEKPKKQSVKAMQDVKDRDKLLKKDVETDLREYKKIKGNITDQAIKEGKINIAKLKTPK